jgi:hypothetical protein
MAKKAKDKEVLFGMSINQGDYSPGSYSPYQCYWIGPYYTIKVLMLIC